MLRLLIWMTYLGGLRSSKLIEVLLMVVIKSGMLLNYIDFSFLIKYLWSFWGLNTFWVLSVNCHLNWSKKVLFLPPNLGLFCIYFLLIILILWMWCLQWFGSTIKQEVHQLRMWYTFVTLWTPYWIKMLSTLHWWSVYTYNVQRESNRQN